MTTGFAARSPASEDKGGRWVLPARRDSGSRALSREPRGESGRGGDQRESRVRAGGGISMPMAPVTGDDCE